MTAEHEERAQQIVRDVEYVAIATSAGDVPWNTPVFAANDRDGNFYWTSSPTSVHSLNIASNGKAFLVIFDSTAPAGEGEGVYITTLAEELTSPVEIQFARDTLDDRAGSGALESDSYYRARPSQAWMNDIEVDEGGEYVRDCRVELDLSVLNATF